MVEMIDVAPLFGVQSATATETEPELLANSPVVNAVEDWVGDTSGAHGPHGENVEPMRRRPAPQSAQMADHFQQGQHQHGDPRQQEGGQHQENRPHSF